MRMCSTTTNYQRQASWTATTSVHNRMQCSALQQRSAYPSIGSKHASRRVLYVAADHTARVRGDARRVQRWVSDVRHWTQFYPGTKSAVKIGSGVDPVRVGSKFETEREMLGLKLPMQYEVLESDPGKRLVLSGISEHHTQMDQFFFMADRHDTNYCCVRYITNVRLREWKRYLQPLANRFVNRVPEQAMDNLQKCLNVGHSPIFSSDFEHTYRKELRSNGSKSYSNGTGRSTGRNGSSSSASGSSSSSSNGVSKGGWLRGLFSSSKKDSSTTSSAAGSRQGQISGSNVVVLDPMGYYNVLGLKPNNQVDEEDIKSAYRKLAMQLHPDRQGGKSDRERLEAAQQFVLLLKAYDTLKDPEQRRLYESGQLVEATLNF